MHRHEHALGLEGVGRKLLGLRRLLRLDDCGARVLRGHPVGTADHQRHRQRDYQPESSTHAWFLVGPQCKSRSPPVMPDPEAESRLTEALIDEVGEPAHGIR